MSDDLRSRAVSSLKAKTHFWQVLGGWALLSLFFVALSAFDGVDTYFWPIWPIGGIAIGVVGAGIAAFGSGAGPSEERIQSEMRRLDS